MPLPPKTAARKAAPAKKAVQTTQDAQFRAILANAKNPAEKREILHAIEKLTAATERQIKLMVEVNNLTAERAHVAKLTRGLTALAKAQGTPRNHD
jgi:hypothetical protein